MTRKLFVLANPTSGTRRIRKVLNDLSDFLTARELAYEVFLTTNEIRGSATVANNLSNEFTDLVIVGGDGTINEAINGLNRDIPVSFVPAGTGNDYVKAFEIGKNRKEYFDTIVSGQVQIIDMGICNERKFLNGVGIGFDGQIVADMLQKSVPILSGHAKYYFHVLSILSSYRGRNYEFKLDDIGYSKNLILLTIAKGTTFGGGFRLNPHARLDDGQFGICEIADIQPLKRYLNLHKLQSGTHDKLKEVALYHGQKVSISKNEFLEGHADGEYIGRPPFDIKILPKSLSIRVKPSA